MTAWRSQKGHCQCSFWRSRRGGLNMKNLLRGIVGAVRVVLLAAVRALQYPDFAAGLELVMERRAARHQHHHDRRRRQFEVHERSAHPELRSLLPTTRLRAVEQVRRIVRVVTESCWRAHRSPRV